MTDLLITDEALIQTALGIAVIAVALVTVLAMVVGFWLAWRTYRHHRVEWATADVRERNKDLLARIAEKDRELERLQETIKHKDERIRSISAAVRGAHVQVGNVTELLTLGKMEAEFD